MNFDRIQTALNKRLDGKLKYISNYVRNVLNIVVYISFFEDDTVGDYGASSSPIMFELQNLGNAMYDIIIAAINENISYIYPTLGYRYDPNEAWAGDGLNFTQRYLRIQHKLEREVDTPYPKSKEELEYSFNSYCAELRRLLVTECCHAVSAATYQYMVNNNIKYYEWVSEPNCCDECSELDGRIFPIELYGIDNIPPLATHPNCRCYIVPILSN